MSGKLRSHPAPATVAAALALIVLGLLTLSGAEAADKQPSCGDMITVDTTLDKDLVDCPNNGIIIGADNITLDLNGHRIDGDGTEFADCPKNTFCDVGVLNDRHGGVKIKGGSSGSSRSVCGSPALTTAGSWTSPRRRTSSSALWSAKSSRSVVRDGSFSNNVAPEGDGIGLFASDHIKIVDNSIEDNPGPGIHIDSTDNLIKQNRLARNGPSMLIDGDDNEVRHNRVVRGAGILVGPGRRQRDRRQSRLAGRRRPGGRGRKRQPRRPQCRDRCPRLRHPPRASAIRRLAVATTSSVGTWSNEAPMTGSASLRRTVDSRLRRNVAIRAGDDGFAIRSPTTKLVGNRALRNADLGIAAVRGVINGGGNVARHNGDHRQCTTSSVSRGGAVPGGNPWNPDFSALSDLAYSSPRRRSKPPRAICACRSEASRLGFGHQCLDHARGHWLARWTRSGAAAWR